MSDRIVHIVGAGPASLVAAINLARAGREAIVHEQKSDISKKGKSTPGATGIRMVLYAKAQNSNSEMTS